MGHRKSPSLHIRFDSFETLDTLEIWANSLGEKIVPWSRRALIRQAPLESRDEIIQRQANMCAIESLYILSAMEGPDAFTRASEHAKNHIDKVENDVARRIRGLSK